jgi:3'5'-cyclic nucleotide phosphodiesterase
MLFSETYRDLRAAIFDNEIDLNRFRQLVVNSVMATDIADKYLKDIRNARWDKAFNIQNFQENPTDVTNRKATIVIEHLIQASDISHTMQHWNIYRKWNDMFFVECYEAYRMGRSDADPSSNWYEGEIKFFDNYVIPLARKLKDCGVFGVSSDEYLNYAMKNRVKWESRGEEIVFELTERENKRWNDKESDDEIQMQ